MKPEDVTFDARGKIVSVRLFARTIRHALAVVAHAEEEIPLGYTLKTSKISRRPRGGRARFVTLTYEHGGSEKYPPMATFGEWKDTMAPEEAIAKGGDLDAEAGHDEADPRPLGVPARR